MNSMNSEIVEKAMQLLNMCFDDIEKFMSRLHLAAAAYKQLHKKSGFFSLFKKQDDLLPLQARPPPAEDFVDIFKKFKFSINVLAKIRRYIFEPSAPEMIQYLFTPLSLLYEASLDPIHEGRDLGAEAVSPLLLPEAIDIMQKCLTEKDFNLLHKMGRPWEIPSDEWRGHVPPYSPVFYGGWQPPHHLIDEIYRLEGTPESEQYNDGAGRFMDDVEPFSDDMRRYESNARWFEGDSGRFKSDNFRSITSGRPSYTAYIIDDGHEGHAYPSWMDDYY